MADPDRIRRLDTGQVGYLYRGGVSFIQVKRLVASQAALARPTAPLVPPVPAEPASRVAGPLPDGLPDISALLDEVFGPGLGGGRS